MGNPRIFKIEYAKSKISQFLCVKSREYVICMHVLYILKLFSLKFMDPTAKKEP